MPMRGSPTIRADYERPRRAEYTRLSASGTVWFPCGRPGRQSIACFVGAVPAKQTDEWGAAVIVPDSRAYRSARSALHSRTNSSGRVARTGWLGSRRRGRHCGAER